MESKREAIQAEINALKSLLHDTDYKANKLIEGLVATMNGATAVNFISRFIGMAGRRYAGIWGRSVIPGGLAREDQRAGG